MKKVFSLLILFSFLGCQLYGFNHKSIKQCKKVDENSELVIEHIKYFNVQKKIHAFYKVINDNIDYILTVKGGVKTMVILMPFFLLYCRYFDSYPIQNIINKIIRFIGKTEGLYKINKNIGETEAFWETLKHAPLSALSVVAKDILHKTIYVGLPFLAGALVSVGLKIKK